MSNEHDGYGVSAETFQEIIRERKAEKNGKAREKRLEVLKSIRDRKSKCGIDPLDQFPKEVWDAVLDKLEQPKDLGNVSQVHHVFSNLLERRKVRDILFPRVVGLPFPTDRRPYRVLPLARNINMRAVSKSMRHEVDRWYEDNLLQHLRCGKNIDPSRAPAIYLESKVVKGLLKNFCGSEEYSNAKHLLFRSLFADLSAPDSLFTLQDEERQRFLEQCSRERNDIRSLLEAIGDQIWNFAYVVDDIHGIEKSGITLPQIYDTLLEWVELMPNLKWLEIRVSGAWSDLQECKGVSIASHLANHPFLKLENLERLDVECYSTTNNIEVFEIFEAILSANRHLRRLRIDGFNDDLLPLLRFAQDMYSLETLSFGGEHENYFDWRLIRPFITSQWHLKQIHLYVGPNPVVVTDIFQVLENFQTLEHVSLKIETVRITGDLKFLILPNLTEFELRFDPISDFTNSSSSVQFFFSLQFLLFCKKLKKLRWEISTEVVEHRKLKRFMTNRECHERMINFRGGYRNLSHSNIWDVFPYLSTIEVNLIEYNPEHILEFERRMEFKRDERDLPN